MAVFTPLFVANYCVDI